MAMGAPAMEDEARGPTIPVLACPAVDSVRRNRTKRTKLHKVFSLQIRRFGLRRGLAAHMQNALYCAEDTALCRPCFKISATPCVNC